MVLLAVKLSFLKHIIRTLVVRKNDSLLNHRGSYYILEKSGFACTGRAIHRHNIARNIGPVLDRASFFGIQVNRKLLHRCKWVF